MSASAYREFVALLRARNLIPEKAPPEIVERPWFVALLQGAAGWLAGIFLIAFIGFMFKPESTGSILGFGALLLGSAWAMYRADRDAVFLDQFALAVSIAGQFAVAWAIIKDNQQGLPISATMLALQAGVLLIMPNKIARTLAALFATIAWVFTVRFALRPGQGEQIFFDYGHREIAPGFGAWTLPVGWALTWLPLLALTIWLIRSEARWMSSGLRNLARPLLTGALLGLSLGGVAAEPFSVLIFGTEAMGMRFTWWALFPLLSVALAMIAAYGAFRVRSGGLLGFAILAALLHLSRFYYLYGTSLMWKSVIMLVAGALLLLAGTALRKVEPEARSPA